MLSGVANRSELARGVVIGGRVAGVGGGVGVLDVAAFDLAGFDLAGLGSVAPSVQSSVPSSVPSSGLGVVAQVTEPDPTRFETPPRKVSRRGLIGMGIAGGLVPSPSALIILLSAIALGRTWFGILLVIGYGLGMAATLTAAGVLLVKVRDRYQHRIHSSSGRVRAAARRWGILAPYFTAGLVLIVGFGLAIRSLGSI